MRPAHQSRVGLSSRRARAATDSHVAFKPDTVPNMLCWFDPGYGMTLTGGNVTYWVDRSLHSTHDVSGSAAFNASDPEYGGWPSVTFDASDDTLVSNTWASSQGAPFVVYIVGHMPSTPNAYNFFFNAYEPGGNNYSAFVDATLQKLGLFASGLAGSSFSVKDPSIFCCEFNGSNSYVAVNTTSPTTLNPGATTAFTKLKLGDYFGGGYPSPLHMAEFLMYSGTHDVLTRAYTMIGLGAKYGMAIT